MFLAIGISLAVSAAGGYAFAHRPHQLTQAEIDAAISNNNQTTSASPIVDNTAQAAASNAPAAAAQSSGLQASGSTANAGLGQLSTTNQSSSKAAANNSTPTSQPFDPSTYGQYEKYKDGNEALMADAQAGNGTELTAGKKAVVYYRGWLTNGSLFDQSRADSKGQLQPFSFTLGSHQVIPGWEQGLAGMKVGGVRLLVIPPSVGYGASGQGSIPPNSVLVFQVQLVDVQ